MQRFLLQIREFGFAGVQNFPTVGLIDGNFRSHLEETGMSYDLEVEMIRVAHELDLLTCPYVFTEQEAVKMTKAGADVLVAHMGCTTGGSIGVTTAMTLTEAAELIQKIRNAAIAINPNVLIICHGGPIAEPEDTRFIYQHTEGVHGFFGASSIERLAVERAITEQTRAFKQTAFRT
jgi:predicted TIM-barrel enzyme